MTAEPPWLATFQAEFGEMLRTPLSKATGTLRADLPRYPAALCARTRPGPTLAAPDRLAVYNRQYWFRLLTAMQGEYRLCVALAGAWSFNGLAAEFLVARPPSGHDLGDVAEDFDDFVAKAPRDIPLPSGGRLPGRALVQATRIDAAFRRVFVAADAPVFSPTPADAGRLATGRLVAHPALSLIEEAWPLMELRRTLPPGPAQAPVPLPPALPAPVWWMLCRAPQGERVVPLVPQHARLIQLLMERPIPHALAQLEAECPATERAALPNKARAWLAQSVSLGLWTALQDGEP